MDVGHSGWQHIMHDSKITKTCFGEFVSGGCTIIKFCDTQNMFFKPNDVGPYGMPINERGELCNGGVKGNKWVNKTKSEIIQHLWLKLPQTSPEKINGKFIMLGKRIYFDKNKKSLKNKDDKNIPSDKSINLCDQYNVDLTKQQLKQKLTKELVAMITERVKEGQETIEFK